jgi:DNA-binding transcriptional LysR family regulator
MPRIVCKEESAAGSLVQVLPEAVRTAPDMFLAFPTRRDISPRVRAFADLLIATLMEVQD